MMKKQNMLCLVSVFLMHSFMVASSSNSTTDELSLLELKAFITSDPDDIITTNWTAATSFCSWVGVTCSPQRQRKRVTALNLFNMSLGGTISPSLGNLSFLVSLDLSENSFHGNLPYQIGYLGRLRVINVQNNQIQGTIPSTLFQCRALQQLALGTNNFTGAIPKEVGAQLPELQILSLSYNAFTGSIPAELGNLTKLTELYITNNKLTGSIPPSIGNISTLQVLSGTENSIQGSIPRELGNLLHLVQLSFEFDNLTGAIPDVIFNISSLRLLAFTSNRLSGTLPTTPGFWLPNLEGIFLADNRLTGDIPIFLSNSTKLLELELSQNLFSGPVPNTLGNLRQLEFLNLENNQLSNEPHKLELEFLTPLVQCRSLQFLVLGFNPLNGILPSSVANLSTTIQMFNIQVAGIKGTIPLGIGNLSDMITLVLSNNELSGTIPSTIGRLQQLQRMYLDDNRLQGPIPNEFCNLNYLGELNLRHGNISGSIPNCIGNLSRLSVVALQSNNLISGIPSSFWSLRDLKAINLSHNSLLNGIPLEVGNLKVVEEIDLSCNQMASTIPSTIGDLTSLRSLNLSHNSFHGTFPRSFQNLLNLEVLDVSSNALSGSIPTHFQNLSHLKLLNVSFNRLSGEIPNAGVFTNLTAQSFIGNEGLCGLQKLQVPPCATNATHKSGVRRILLRYVLPVAAFTTLSVAFLLWWIIYRVKKRAVGSPVDIQPKIAHRLISYQELLQATENFSESNLLGRGSFSSVYKGVLSDGTISAVKVLDLKREGAFKSFDVECQVISSIRHRNLIKIISTCSNLEFRAIILQYMPNGSLENWLYSDKLFLDVQQRIDIMLDVAMALDYLHNYYSEPVVHCDLKPSNILFDEEMVAHVGDFGITKILADNESATQTKTLGTIGYIAPEYGSEGRVSTSCDVYSYGIVLLETFTGKRPTNDMFTDGWSLRQWVMTLYRNKVMEIIDTNILNDEKWTTERQECVSSILELALECSRDLAEERINMNQVVARLAKIKSELTVY